MRNGERRMTDLFASDLSLAGFLEFTTGALRTSCIPCQIVCEILIPPINV